MAPFPGAHASSTLAGSTKGFLMLSQERLNSIICKAIDSIEADLEPEGIDLQSDIDVSNRLFDSMQSILDKYSSGYSNHN